jgi:hypothetical protein
MDKEDIEGQEWEVAEDDEGIKIEAFNMDNEMEEGLVYNALLTSIESLMNQGCTSRRRMNSHITTIGFTEPTRMRWKRQN